MPSGQGLLRSSNLQLWALECRAEGRRSSRSSREQQIWGWYSHEHLRTSHRAARRHDAPHLRPAAGWRLGLHAAPGSAAAADRFSRYLSGRGLARRQSGDDGFLGCNSAGTAVWPHRWHQPDDQMTSSSQLGSTGVTMQFDLDRNIDAAARDVQAAINAARGYLPADLP